jgi:hypothetical protein
MFEGSLLHSSMLEIVIVDEQDSWSNSTFSTWLIPRSFKADLTTSTVQFDGRP